MSTTEMSTIPVETIIEEWKVKKATEIKDMLHSYLFSSGKLSITNKARRQIKKLFNEQINLTDRMFQGFHTDGSEIGSMSNDAKEIDMLFQILKKTPTLSFSRAEKTIKKWIQVEHTDSGSCPTTSEPLSKRKQLIIAAYEKYVEEARAKKVVVKTRGLDFVTKCEQYWKSSEVDPVLEEQIEKAANELKTLVYGSFDESFTFESFAESLVPVLDISGSMNGTPMQTGLFYLFMLVKVFGVKTVHYFETNHTVKNISPGWETNLDLIRQIYCNTTGSTNLDSVFRYLNLQKTSNKNIIIITDSDCDPSYGGTKNPFHEVTKIDKTKSHYSDVIDCNYVVVNVKITDLSFPYLNLDPRVCYLTGNNPKTLNGFIKALCEATKMGITITPELILKYTLSLDELKLENPVPKYSSVLSEERITNLFKVFTKNLPPKDLRKEAIKVVLSDSDSNSCDKPVWDCGW